MIIDASCEAEYYFGCYLTNDHLETKGDGSIIDIKQKPPVRGDFPSARPRP